MQRIVFRTPDWEDGYGDGLLAGPPRERTAWLDPDDRSSMESLLLTCARENIAAIGWCEAVNDYQGPKRSPLLWRVTPGTECRWAGHVWDACTIRPDGSYSIALRLMVLFVAWRLDGDPIWGQHIHSRLPQGTNPDDLRPYISPYVEDDNYCLIEGADIDKPVTLELGEMPSVTLDRFHVSDRLALEQALRDAIIQRFEEGNSPWVWNRSQAETDSHFGRWYQLQLQRLQADAGTRGMLQWDWSAESLPLHKAAYDAAMARGDVPAVLPCTVAGHRSVARTRSHPFDRGRGTTFMRMTIRDVVWHKGKVKNLDYAIEPELIDRRA